MPALHFFLKAVEPGDIERYVLRLPFVAFADDAVGHQQGKHRGRHAGVELQFDEHRLDLLHADAEREADADLVHEAEVVAVDALRGDGGDAAQLGVEARFAPDAAPHHLVTDQGVVG